MSKNYFALTIGPIYETMQKSEKTRSLWASSYLFSYLIRCIAEKIREAVSNENYIMPHLGNPPKNGAGLYPDRIIAIIPKGKSYEQLKAIAVTEIAAFSEKIAFDLKLKEQEVKNYFNSYIRCICKEVELSAKENIITSIYKVLDQEELKPKIPVAAIDKVTEFINNVNGSFLVDDGFDKKEQYKAKYVRFDSIIEVSAKTLEIADNNKFSAALTEDEDVLISNLKKSFEKEFRPHQKYIAIVNADGDAIGKTIEAIGEDKEKVKKFSKFLYDFAAEATNKVKTYGGMPIYMGGDDMLFFAPVAVKEGNRFENIFDLCNQLDKLFEDAYKKLAIDLVLTVKQPTMSYGVSITYYKYPLYEALLLSHHNLWDKAKEESLHKNKNTMSLTLQKHSGQIIKADFEKDKEGIYTTLSGFITKWTKNEVKDDYLNSVVSKLEFLSPLFEAACDEGISLNYFFDKHFNEDVHKNKAKPFLDDLKILAAIVYKTNVAENTKLLYTALRFIHFINQEKDER